jgi:hypothetical protein
MTLEAGKTFTMDRAQVVYTDTYGGVKTVVAKGCEVVVEAVYPTRVALRFEGGLYDVAKSGCYALMTAGDDLATYGWKWDDNKGVYRRAIEGEHRVMEVLSSVALRLLRNAS